MNNEQIAKWSGVELTKIEAWSNSQYFDDKNKLTCVTLKAESNKKFSEHDFSRAITNKCVDSIDIMKTWATTSHVVRGGYSQITCGSIKHKRSKVI